MGETSLSNQQFYQEAGEGRVGEENPYVSLMVGRIEEPLTEAMLQAALANHPQLITDPLMESEMGEDPDHIAQAMERERPKEMGSRYMALLKRVESDEAKGDQNGVEATYTLALVGEETESFHLFTITVTSADPALDFHDFQSGEPLSADLIKRANRAPYEIVVASRLGADCLAAYWMQLKVLHLLAPKLLIVCDISGGSRLFSPQWLAFQAESPLPPPLTQLYVIRALYDERESGDRQYWFHTLGLLRCGYPEIEILVSEPMVKSDEGELSLEYIEQLIESQLSAWLDQGVGVMAEGIPLSQVGNHQEFYYGLPWEIGLQYVESGLTRNQWRSFQERLQEAGALEQFLQDLDQNRHHFLGDYGDRLEENRAPSLLLFKGRDEEERLTDCLAGYGAEDGILFLRSEAENERLSAVAKGRWHYLQHFFEQHGDQRGVNRGLLARLFRSSTERGWQFTIKVHYCDRISGVEEQLWFALLEIEGEELQGRLLSEPYGVNLMQEGVYTVEKAQISDWRIETEGGIYTPYTVYQLLQ